MMAALILLAMFKPVRELAGLFVAFILLAPLLGRLLGIGH